ncbi:dynamin family protein [Tenuibacillus multivorans]|uniref:Small GTP-binding protein domain-containing protein n=1 Tax=Tenuibacillus multivorans TaxID=237069 RepID=A0A1H0CPC8_9BACI|nr:dynamin family protein [Tenuibacillus multivorans]GEL76218.1 GTPase [Tenuibacillus multivorans]SDN59749.1 small GTP-binding protein domain-containing protein [Tenuibacillus multivorans]
MITSELVKSSINFDELWKELSVHPYANLDQKLIQLYEKWRHQRLTIGFTGHFSAGKSSLINALVKEDLLPSSPIPTSANIVDIRYGEDEVIYHLTDGRCSIENNINLNHVKQLSKNGETVQSLTIKKPLPVLKSGVSLMDTPGIDSSDDEEFNRTLSQVHMIDYFVYVMDYNHVQSEVNFHFLKELEENHVPYVIVVNQIDKHNEHELSFDKFKKSLKDSCQAWQLQPEKIFYTTLIDLNHSLNQLDELNAFMDQIIEDKDQLIHNKTEVELIQLIDQWTDEKLKLNNQNYSDLTELRESNKRLINEMNQIENDRYQFDIQLKDDLSNLLNNAYLMTFDTREIAKAYLESLQPKFKVGTLFSKKKTLEEKVHREEQFQSDINKRVKSEIIWHVRHLLINQLKDYQMDDFNLHREIQQFEVDITSDHLSQAVNPSAEVNADSVLVYTNQLQKNITQLIKKETKPLIDQMSLQYDEKAQQYLSDLERQLHDVDEEMDQYTNLQQLEAEKEALKQKLIHHSINAKGTNETIQKAHEDLHKQIPSMDVTELLHDYSTNPSQDDKEEAKERSKINEFDVYQIIDRTEQIIEEIKPFKPLSQFYKALNQQLDKLQNTELTVALFGAFSAGKSSFANAWVGEELLPASPNPTTAAINKICPVTPEKEHGTVSVKYKNGDMMVDQLGHMISPFTSQEFSDLNEVTRFIQKNKSNFTDQLSKTEISFIEAFLTGISDAREWLGHERIISIDEFSRFVTEESISCFIHEISVYYDCELTRRGVTLVDTPGADSIHARHTNTSFHYVKHSDAIIYVNYYNHAFSRADREFLLQLGRVKDAFALDKMFFILNAADLASSKDELSLVQNYLFDQLTQYGINQPAIYPLSSKRLLKDNDLSHDVEGFFTRFNDFIEQDAKQLMSTNLVSEQSRLAKFLDSTIKEANENPTEQQDLINRLMQELTQLNTKVKQDDPTLYINSIKQEINELAHHIKDRTMIQFNDLLKETINPATVTANGKKGKLQIKIAIKQLFSKLQEKLSNEFQTTHILLDRKLNRVLDERIKDINQYIIRETSLAKLFKTDLTLNESMEPELLEAIYNTQLEPIINLYKNKKEFFEEQKIKDMYAQLQELAKSALDYSTSQMQQVFKHHYEEEYNLLTNQLFKQYKNENEELINYKEEIYNDDQLLSRFKEIKQNIIV